MARSSVGSGSPLRLLMPTVRSPIPHSSVSLPFVLPPRSPRIRPTTGRLSGVRSHSGSATTSIDKSGLAGTWNSGKWDTTDGEHWIGHKYRFEVVEERMELVGYQVYAVEKWIVERTRPVTVLTVYTGDPSHKIVVTALSPLSTMTASEADAEFKAAVQYLRKQNGARPRETSQGTLMVTSLAHFRSDYTIVQIPDGDLLSAQERLYSNINLLRMGCSGRSAVTLEEPSDTTKDRFKSMYFLSDGPPPAGAFRSKSHSRTHTRAYSQPVTALSPAVPEAVAQPKNANNANVAAQTGPSRHPHFALCVLELVKLVQASLGICGMFPLTPPFDGLLCDVTIDGLRRWAAEIGDNLIGSESTERIADPSLVAALLSFVLSTRNKLAVWIPAITKDPFLHPLDFLTALSSLQHTSPGSLPASVNTSSNTLPLSPLPPSSTTGSPLVNLLHSSTTPITYLTLALHKLLLSQHDPKLRHSDSRRVHRVILSKLDLTSDSEATDDERKWLGGRVMGLVGRASASGPGSVNAPTADLAVFVREIVSGRERERDRERGREKDTERERDKEKPVKDTESPRERIDDKEKIGGSLKALWSGKVDLLARMRERAEGRSLRRGTERESEGDRNGEKEKDRITLSDLDDLVVAKPLADDDLAFGGAWSGKVQKRLEMWTGINRSKKLVDHSSPTKFGGRTSSVTIPLSTQSSSSGHVYLASELQGLGIPTVVLSHDNGDEDELLSSGQVSPASVSRTHTPFTLDASTNVSSANLIAPENKHQTGDPIRLGRHNLDSGVSETGQKTSAEWEHITGGRGEAWWKARVAEDKAPRKATRTSLRPTRRHTFHDLSSVQHVPVLRMDWMRIDVELCGQVLMMQRRETHLEGVIRCLEHLTTTLARASTTLRNTHTAHKLIIDSLTSHDPPSVTASPTPTLHVPLPSASHTYTPPGLTPVMAALHALPVTPAVPALQYEAAQLRVDDMWGSTREFRKKVWELRSVVFGRENVLGVGGAGPGRGRRRWTSQWKLDGTECLVDALGRTESEAEEERAIIADGERSEGEDETESEWESGMEKKGVPGDVEERGESEAMGPMWLLRVFMSWGTRLGIVKGEADVGGTGVSAIGEPSPSMILGGTRVSEADD